MASSLAAISGVSSHELIVEMRADKGEKNLHFSDREERKAFTGPCIIKQLRKLIRDTGGGGADLTPNYCHSNCISHL